MQTKLDTLSSQFSLSPRQKEFCATLSKVIGKPDFDRLDTRHISLTVKRDDLCLVLPHHDDPCQTIVVVLAKGCLRSLQVWGFEFFDMIEATFLNQDSPDLWVLKITDLLQGRVYLEKWTKDQLVLQSRISRYSNDLGKWIVGTKLQTGRTRFLGIQFTRSAPPGEGLPPGCLREAKYVSFCSNHGVPRLGFTL